MDHCNICSNIHLSGLQRCYDSRNRYDDFSSRYELSNIPAQSYSAVPGVPPPHAARPSPRPWCCPWSPFSLCQAVVSSWSLSSSRCHAISQAVVPSLESLLLMLPGHQPGCGVVPGVPPPHAATPSARPWCRPWSPSSSRCQAVVSSLESLLLTLPRHQLGRGAVPGVPPPHTARLSARQWCCP